MDVPVDKIGQFEDDFLGQLEIKHKNVLETLRKGQLSDEVISTLESLAKELAGKYKV